MRIILTFVAFIICQSVFSQQIYHVTQSGSGDKSGESWENASDDLAKTVDNAQFGDTVWVAAGTYLGGFYMKEGVSVYGGFAGNETSLDARKMPGTHENITTLDGNGSYRVLTQDADFIASTIWDGFVIQNGSSRTGGGVYLRKNGIVRRCIIKGNSTTMPAVGDYIPQEGGVVFQVNKLEKKVWIISEEDCGRTYHIYNGGGNENINNIADAVLDMNGKINTYSLTKSDVTQVVKAYRGAEKSDWYIPSVGEWSQFLKLQDDGSFKKTKTYELVEASLFAYGRMPLFGKGYWSSTLAEHNGMASSWYINFQNEDIQKINIWQYEHVRGIRYYTIADGTGKGGGIYALDGSHIEGCLLSENQSSAGSAIYATGNVMILNNTIISNQLESSSSTSSAIDANSTVMVCNTIVAGNLTAAGEYDKYAGEAYYAYSAIESSAVASGQSNILVDNISELGFVDYAARDYKLLPSSILLEKGNTVYLPVGLDSDLSGDVRISNRRVSIGAYQQYYTSGTDKHVFSGLRIYPNPVKINDIINIDLSPIESVALVEIFDMYGKKIISKKGYDQIKIQAPKSTGIYVLKITLSAKTVSEYKLIVI